MDFNRILKKKNLMQKLVKFLFLKFFLFNRTKTTTKPSWKFLRNIFKHKNKDDLNKHDNLLNNNLIEKECTDTKSSYLLNFLYPGYEVSVILFHYV